MFLKFKIFCTCHCEYTANENISTSKIICPNCGLEYPYSDKLLLILNTAKDIPKWEYGSNEIRTEVISQSEEDNWNQWEFSCNPGILWLRRRTVHTLRLIPLLLLSNLLHLVHLYSNERKSCSINIFCNFFPYYFFK